MHNFVRNYIIAGLLLVLPFAMQGQTIKRFESEGWWQALTQGTVIRPYDIEAGQYYGKVDAEILKQGFAIKRVGKPYMIFDDGIGSVVSFDYVNGFSYGPDMTFGYVDDNYGRWELSPELRYSERLHNWRGELVARYTLPPAYYSWVEAFYRRKCIDFDNYAFTSLSLNSMAAAIAGWNGYKLYEAEQIGFKSSTAISRDFQFEIGGWYERRWQMDNHRKKNIFHVTGEDNIPRLRGVSLADPLHQWGVMKLWRIDAALEFTYNRWFSCYNDLRTSAVHLPSVPVVRLSAQSGWGDVDYLSLELNVNQMWGDRDNTFSYSGSAGFYPVGNNDVPVMDMHHFDATHMVYQRSNSLTWFSLLSNYELSTSQQWAELHGEWKSCNMAVSRLTHDPALCEYVQLHTVNVAGHRQHTEVSYGFDLADMMRIGCSFGWDGTSFDGVGLNIVFRQTKLGEYSKVQPLWDF